MGGILKGVGKLIGIDYDGAVKAGKMQADAITASANAASTDSAMQAQSAAQQMQAAATTRQQQQQANDLLNVPVQTASVDLASTAADDATADDDILMKRRGARAAYQAAPATSGLVV